MQTFNKITLHIGRIALCFSICLAGCKKTLNLESIDAGSINVTNAIVNGTNLSLMTDNSIVSSVNTINSNGYAFMPVSSGQPIISIGIPAIPATDKAPAVPAVVYYSQSLSIDDTTTYSLFLTGASLSAVENVLIKDHYTHTYDDSICGVRFINLAPGSQPVTVNLQGNPAGSASGGLAYKSYSDFIQYPAKKAIPSYTFEFRDAATSNLITTYTLITPYFHNVTLALRGIVGGSPSPGVILDNDY